MRNIPKVLFLNIVILFLSIPKTLAKPLFVLAVDSGFDPKPWPIFLANIPNSKSNKIQPLQMRTECAIKPMPLQLKTGLQPETEVLSLVFAGRPKQKEPASAFKGFREFIAKNQDRPKMIYALASHGTQNNACLYQFDARTGQELAASSLPYPIVAGSLILEDVYFNKAWHSILLIDTSTQLLLFDVSNPKQIQGLSTQAFLPISNPSSTSFMAISKPKIICTDEGQWGILRGGRNEKEGVLGFTPFQFPMQESFIPISGTQGLAVLIPVDLDFKGEVQQVYAIDEGGVFWKIDLRDRPDIQHLKNLKTLKAGKMPQTPPFLFSKNIYLLKSPNGKEVECLGLQMKKDEQNKKDLEENAIKIETLMINQQVLAEGRYLDFYFCAGNLILIPRSEDQKPELFARTWNGYKKIICDGANHSNGNHGANQRSMTQLETRAERSIRVQATCIYEGRKKQLKIISLNEDGLLSVLDKMPLGDSADSADSAEGTKHSDGSDHSKGFGSLKAKKVTWRKIILDKT